MKINSNQLRVGMTVYDVNPEFKSACEMRVEKIEGHVVYMSSESREYGRDENGLIQFLLGRHVWYLKEPVNEFQMPKGFQSWARTHHEVVAYLERNKYVDEVPSRYQCTTPDRRYDIAVEATNRFEKAYARAVFTTAEDLMNTVSDFMQD